MLDSFSPIILLARNADPSVAFILILGAIAFFVVRFFEEVKKQRLKREWSSFSKQLGASFNTEDIKSPIGNISLRVQGTPVTIDGRIDLNPSSLLSCTRISTQVSMPRGFSLLLTRESAIDSLSKALGGQDIILGDEAFDRAFLVRSNDELLCRLWLNAMVRPLLLLSESYTFSVQESTAMLVRSGHEANLPALKQAVDICAKLGKHAAKLSESWQAIAKRFQGRIKRADGASPLPHNSQIEFESQGCPCLLSLLLTKHAGLLTKISIQRPGSIGIFSIAPAEHPIEQKGNLLSIPGLPTRYLVFANNKDDAQRTISAQVIQSIQKITPYALTSSSLSVEILLPGFVYTPETLQQALDLMHIFVSQSDGPYR